MASPPASPRHRQSEFTQAPLDHWPYNYQVVTQECNFTEKLRNDLIHRDQEDDDAVLVDYRDYH